MTSRKMLSITLAVAAVCFLAASSLTAAVPNITFTASGTFATPATSGADTLKLAGEPFTVSIAAPANYAPYQHGPNWAAFNKLKLTGTVHSGLLGATPVNIASAESTIIQAFAPNQFDSFTMEAPVKVTGISLTIKAVIIMPYGTFPNPLLHIFNPIALAPGNATVTYASGSENTVLAIQNGTLTATAPGGASVMPLMLHSGGAQAVTLHQDGTTSTHTIGAGAVDSGMASDAVTLKFYASGVSGASDVHLRVGGDELPLAYAGASGYFPGLDEVMVQLPRSMAGRGTVEVSLTADGQTAKPIQIHIQ